MTALTTSSALSESHAREEICRVGKSLFERGYVHATAGNISVRLDNGFLITPTDACLGFLDAAKLSLLDANGHHVSGDKPSMVTMLVAINQARQLHCIVVFTMHLLRLTRTPAASSTPIARTAWL